MYLPLEKTAFDIDGVVVDIITPFLDMLAERFGYGGFTPEDVTDFDLATSLGVPAEVINEVVCRILNHPTEFRADPYPGAAEVLTRLGEQAPLLFVTARDKDQGGRLLLERALPDLPADRYEVVATGDPLKKLEHLRDHGRLHLIDDHLETCRQLARAGLEPIIFDQPWNRRADNLPRVRGWAELSLLFER